MTTRLFCDEALAARIERAETELIVTTAGAARTRDPDGFAIPVAGGAAVFAEPGSPMNKVVGLGFGGPPDPAALDRIERAYAARGAPTQVELAHLVDPDIAAALTDRGYRLESFEDVLGRALDRAPDVAMPPGIEVRRTGDDDPHPFPASNPARAHPCSLVHTLHDVHRKATVCTSSGGVHESGGAGWAPASDGPRAAERGGAQARASAPRPANGR